MSFQRSFLKWPGGKYRVLHKLIPLLPSGDRLIEPFAGSCVVSLNTNYPRYLLADANLQLINTLEHVAQGMSVDRASTIKQYFVTGNNKETYNLYRKQFNMSSSCCEKSDLFIYLNRHCFNDLWRCNRSGEFNVPFGKYKKPKFPESEMIAFRSKFGNSATSFQRAYFWNVMDPHAACRGDVYYCDPPYLPVSKTANFTYYTGENFTADDHERLVKLAKAVARKGAVVIISNSDTEYSRELYKEASIFTVEARRSISAKKESRGKAKELIAIY